ncbi:MAG: hypothetical protein SXG53_24390 [Pseudomonadota bacterium]|nr:hypothetical protein [Pseudomonadota bacterium]
MNTHVEKTQGNKRKMVSHAAAGKRSDGESIYQFADNRLEALALRKLQDIADNSPQAKQAAQLQAMVSNLSARRMPSVQKNEKNSALPDNLKREIQNLASHSKSTPAQPQTQSISDSLNSPIQRVVDQATAEHSANNQYFIAPGNRSILYSDVNAAAPLPTGLYARGNDALNDLAQTPLYSWTPNVRLFSNAEAGTAGTNRTRQVPSDSFCGLAGMLGFTMDVPDHTLEDNLIGNLRGRITGLANAPTRGVIGKNDCREFATYLHNAIGSEIAAPNAAPRAPQETRLGDRMGHTLTDPNDCPYHYATIVATDAASKVTLEANAGFDLTEPEFFLRNGITGFMNANNANYDNGQAHTITGIETSSQVNHQAALHQSHLQQNAQQRGTYATTGNGGGGRRITATVAEV